MCQFIQIFLTTSNQVISATGLARVHNDFCSVSMFDQTCPAGKSAATESKNLALTPIQRVEMVSSILGESPSDMTIFEYIRSNGILDTLYRVIPESRVKAANARVVKWVVSHPTTGVDQTRHAAPCRQ